MVDLTVKQVAEELGLAENTVRRLLNEGIIPGYRVNLNNVWRVTREQLDNFKASGGVRKQGRPRKTEEGKSNGEG